MPDEVSEERGSTEQAGATASISATAPASTPAAAPPTGAAGWGEGADYVPDPRRWIALGIVLTGAFMVLLDISIVNVAIPSIQTNLHASFAQVQLVLAGYQMAYAVVLITGGRLGDINGRKRMFMLGMAGFVLASASCGLAQTADMLVFSRVVQGLMAALMYPQVLSVIQVTFPPRERAAAFGIFGSTIGIATIAGPLLGGLIIRSDITGSSWRWVFLVNVPVGVASLIAAARLMSETKAPQGAKLDIPGVLIVSAALFLLAFPLVEGRDQGWPGWAFLMLALSVPAIAGFALLERTIERRNGKPLVPLSLFKDRAFTAGMAVSSIFFAGIPSFFFTFGLTVQIGLHFSALHAGLVTAPFAIGSASASAMSVRLAPKLGKNILFIGSGLLVIGMLATVATLHWRGTDLNGVDLIPAMFISGVGLGCTVAPLVNVILAGIRSADAGSAAGVLSTFQQVGGALGVAIIGVIFFGLLGNRAGNIAQDNAAQLRADLIATHQLPPQQADQTVAIFVDCFSRRANSKDPSETPPGCPDPARATPGPVTTVIQDASNRALGENFTEALERALLFNAVVFGSSGLLVLLLPRPPRTRPPGAGAAGAH